MDIRYNNEIQPSNLVTFTDIPNILKVEDTTEGEYAVYNFVINTSLAPITTKDGQWYITFLGETITNVLDPRNAINKNFYIGNNASTAVSMARAFKNCPYIAANFTIEYVQYGIANAVRLTAKEIGSIWTGIENYLDTNISSTYMNMSGTDGMAYSVLNGALIDVDVYTIDGGGNDVYVTTLEKSWYNGEAAFNMSPVLTTVAEYGKTVPYKLKIGCIDKYGDYSALGTLNDNYVAEGYMCNQGSKYIPLYDGALILAQNISRGDNGTTLYVYKPEIPITFYSHMVGGGNITVDYLDSAFNAIYTNSGSTWRNTDSEQKLKEFTVYLNQGWLDKSFYIDVTFGGGFSVRYNVIKPLKATEHCQRLIWRNEYGGKSFFDFTGQITVQNDSERMTYEKNAFDYYTAEMNAKEKVYDVSTKTTYTIKSHLMDADGRWIFYSLMDSPLVWTTINGEDYEVIIDSVSVEETTDRNNVYEATVKFHISMPITLY